MMTEPIADHRSLAALAAPAVVEKAGTEAPSAADKARAAAETFESFFLAQVMQNMYAGISTGGPFGGGASEGIYRSLLNERYSEAISNRGGIGIADAVYREILRMQEVQPS